MKVGLSSYTYGWGVGVPGWTLPQPLTPMTLLERTAALGVHVLQICDNLPLDALDAAALDAFLVRAGQLDVAIEVGTRGIAPAHLRNYIRLAKQAGSPICRVVVDTPAYQPTVTELVGALRAMLPEFEAAGVVLAIENHDRFLVRELVAVMEQVNSPSLGICLDTANSFGALEGPDIVVPALAPWTVNLHLKDFAIERLWHNLGFVVQGRPLGQGCLDVPWLLESLAANGRDVNAIIEQWTPPEDDLAETVCKEADWAEQSVRYLRGIIPD